MVSALAESPALLALLCGVLGLMIGSFLNVVVYRLPRVMQRSWARDALDLLEDSALRLEIQLDEATARSLETPLQGVRTTLDRLAPLGLALPPSRCPHCGHAISAIENIPVVSWVALRGRCSACHAPIGLRYPLVEASVGILFALAGWRFGWTWQLAAALVIIGTGVALTLIDADVMLLPDALTLTLLWLGILANLNGWGFAASLSQSVLGAVAGYSAFWIIGTTFRLVRGIEGMGAGDYKLLAAFGAWFGWPALLPIVLMSAGVGSVVGLTLMALGRATTLTRLPFGVYLAPAGIIMLFLGQRIMALLLPSGH